MKFGIGIGIIILNKYNDVLLLLRHSDAEIADSDMHLEGLWTLPSGKVKYGETFEIAATRKVYEETNLKINNPIVVSLSNDINEYSHYATIGLVTNNYSGEVNISDEFVDCKWCNINDLPNNICLPSKKILNNYIKHKIYNDKEYENYE